jgi:hypothetical protein
MKGPAPVPVALDVEAPPVPVAVVLVVVVVVVALPPVAEPELVVDPVAALVDCALSVAPLSEEQATSDEAKRIVLHPNAA